MDQTVQIIPYDTMNYSIIEEINKTGGDFMTTIRSLIFDDDDDDDDTETS